jgi:hypothetical protein
MALGETGNFAAYGVAPITVIAPLGCMSVTGEQFCCVLTNRNVKKKKKSQDNFQKKTMQHVYMELCFLFHYLLSCCHINHEET